MNAIDAMRSHGYVNNINLFFNTLEPFVVFMLCFQLFSRSRIVVKDFHGLKSFLLKFFVTYLLYYK